MATARSTTNRRPAELEALAGPRSAGLPFLPTLVTALLIGAASLLCRQPATSVPAPAESVVVVAATFPAPGSDGFHGARMEEPDAPRTPAAIAFNCVYPIVIETGAERVAASGKPAPTRTARSLKRHCIGQKCPDAIHGEPARGSGGDTARHASLTPTMPIPAPRSVRDESETDSSEDEHPILSTTRVVVSHVRSLSDTTLSLSDAVMEGLASLD